MCLPLVEGFVSCAPIIPHSGGGVKGFLEFFFDVAKREAARADDGLRAGDDAGTQQGEEELTLLAVVQFVDGAGDALGFGGDGFVLHACIIPEGGRLVNPF